MTTTRRTLLSLGAGLGLTLAAAPAFAQDVTLRMHQFLPQDSNVPHLILDEWARRIEEGSDGRIAVEHYPSMQLGGTPPELIDQVIDGVADVIWTVAGYTPGRFPSMEVIELPFLVDSAEQGSRALWTVAEENDLFSTEFSDFHVLGLWVHGPGIIHTNVQVQSVDDMSGLQIRTPTRTATMFLEELGATPVGMPVPAIPEAISKGVIQAAATTWEVSTSLRLAELVDHHTEFPGKFFYTTAFIFAMNNDVYNGLPDDLKAVIDENSGLEFSAFAGRVMEESDAPARQIAVDRGNTIDVLTPEQVAPFEEAGAVVRDAWVAEMDAAGRDGTKLLEDAEQALADNATTTN